MVHCPECEVQMNYVGRHTYRCPGCKREWWRAPMDSKDSGYDVLLDVTENEQEEEDDTG
jgi:tRNA(Ile2) C34 agmatinyltransferase TiaS